MIFSKKFSVKKDIFDIELPDKYLVSGFMFNSKLSGVRLNYTTDDGQDFMYKDTADQLFTVSHFNFICICLY